LDHVKRVNHQKGSSCCCGAAAESYKLTSIPALLDKGTTLVAIAPVDMISQDTLQSELADFSASLNHTDIIVASVPATFARTLEEVAEKAKIWPVLLNAVPRHPADTPWTVSRKAWVRKGVQRLVELAQSAAEDGELPIAALAYSAPLDAQPSDPDLIPPTAHMRASGVDRRKGMNHPLKHAAMGCVAEIARLRTCSPFTETTSSTRNGADYLLTSMSLFITHEPCVMCTMALVHSRVKEVFFLVRNAEGGFGGAFDVHGHPGLNHKIDVFDCSMLLEEGVLQRLDLPEGVEP
jgi:tRNA-specific adenosine deaminase 3